MRPSQSSRALEAIIRDLIATRDGATYFAQRVWGVGVRYDLGGEHPLVGRSVPDFDLAGGTRLHQHLRTGHGLLLDFEECGGLKSLACRWKDRVRYVASDAKDRLGLSALLVRPDGIVAWASDIAGDETGAACSLSKWFGEPLGEAGASQPASSPDC